MPGVAVADVDGDPLRLALDLHGFVTPCVPWVAAETSTFAIERSRPPGCELARVAYGSYWTGDDEIFDDRRLERSRAAPRSRSAASTISTTTGMWKERYSLLASWIWRCVP